MKNSQSEKKIVHKLYNFYKKYRKFIHGITLVLVFLIIFTISVAGGLRVFFPYVTEITGFPLAQKNYLIVFQNNTELRPSGGFISSYGLVQFQSGFLKSIDISDVYGDIDNHPYLDPPYPMKELLANKWYKGYTFRDGNYQANFPDSAEELERLLRITKPKLNIDGVMAINFSFLEDLLDAVGSIEVEGKIFDSNNLFESLESEVNDIDKHDIVQLKARKGILKPLTNALIKKILFNPFMLRKVSDTITTSLAKKDIQFYFTNPSLKSLVRKENWAGAWPDKVAGDFLAVVEANLGGMKSDRYIQRKITYHVFFDEDSLKGIEPPKAELELQLYHFGIENIPLSGPYTGYFRFYKASAEKNPVDEIVKLQIGEKKTVAKKFTLPVNILNSDREYSLFIPKQSGKPGDDYTVIVEAPRGYSIQSDDFQSKENFGFFEGKLNKDWNLKLKILDDKNPPRLVLQELTELNKISLHFNEDLNQDFAQDIFSYEIYDLNTNHPEKTDQLTVKKVVTTSKDIDIYVKGMTNQPEEHYGVVIKGQRDTRGNLFKDRQITVVQRLE